MIKELRKTMKQVFDATKRLKVSRSVDVFAETDCSFNLERIDYDTNRKLCNANFSYIVSPEPNSNSTAPSITFDDIVTNFEESTTLSIFNDNKLKVLNYSFEQGDVVTDPTTGTVSLGFQINIRVININ
ncbi:hypothetical protein GKQ23_13055 [Erwinia sp. E602]|uniref:hypothetical protein n=1 Tax=Erwinia sp. E602 TaxID=2675378 RepID=UPI001BAA7993|nr:hypothetical protein [Erwinia sp. E602]QUG75863.1 hypothetical protein GKQ23_13055 [Erwinia sp. E602]